MQAVLVLFVLAVVGSTAWLALDASKRDWTDNSFAKNVPSWAIGSLLLWPIVFPMYVFSHRKNAPLLAKPEAAPAAAMAAAGPSEQYGPSIDEIEQEEPAVEIVEPEPVVQVEPEPVVDVAPPEPVVDVVAPEPVVDVVPSRRRLPERAVEVGARARRRDQPARTGRRCCSPGARRRRRPPEPVVDVVPPEPTVEVEPEPVLEISEPEPVAFQPEPRPRRPGA